MIKSFVAVALIAFSQGLAIEGQNESLAEAEASLQPDDPQLMAQVHADSELESGWGFYDPLARQQAAARRAAQAALA